MDATLDGDPIFVYKLLEWSEKNAGLNNVNSLIFENNDALIFDLFSSDSEKAGPETYPKQVSIPAHTREWVLLTCYTASISSLKDTYLAHHREYKAQ